MNRVIKSFGFFLLGVCLMAVFQLLTRCNKDDDFLKNSISKEEQKQDIDYKAIKSAGSQYQKAFSSGDQSAVDAITFDETLTFFAENPQYSSQELSEIGNAMQKAKLNAATGNFAEYTYVIEKVEFTFTMAFDSDGQWKLVRY